MTKTAKTRWRWTIPALIGGLAIVYVYAFLVRYDKVYVYGIADKNSQDSIALTLQLFRRRYHSRKILIQFFENENWKTWSNPDTGAHGGERGPEISTRLIWIR